MLREAFFHLFRDGKLLPVVLVSKRFEDVVEEFLYHTISLNATC